MADCRPWEKQQDRILLSGHELPAGKLRMSSLDARTVLSLLVRMGAVLVVFALVTVPIALTAVAVAGFLGWLALLAGSVVLTVVTKLQRLCSQFGVAYFSRGRELAADRGAARLTGDLAALASALRTLTETRSAPTEDLRTFEQSSAVLDILPTEDDRSAGPFRTHPDTERRIRRLERLAVDVEQA